MASALTQAGTVGLAEAQTPAPSPRLRALFDARYREIWRLLRRLGVASSAVDDAAQRVFVIAAFKLGAVAEGKEFSFLYGISTRVAAEERRKAARLGSMHNAFVDAMDDAPGADEVCDRRKARALLDEVLERLPDAQREVFVLFELEGLEIREIATLLEVPVGTVGSRLRAARETFAAGMQRVKARLGREGGAA